MAPIQKMGVCPGSGRQREDRRGNGDQLTGERGERRQAAAGRVQAGGEAQADSIPVCKLGVARSSARSESSAADTPSSPYVRTRPRDPRAQAGINRQSPLPQPHASHGVVDRQQRRHAGRGTDPSPPRRPAQLGSELCDVILRSDATHDRRSQSKRARGDGDSSTGGGAPAGRPAALAAASPAAARARRQLRRQLSRQLGGKWAARIDRQRHEHRRDARAGGAVPALIPVLPDLACRENPVRHAEIDDLDQRGLPRGTVRSRASRRSGGTSVTSSLQTASGRGQVLGPPITDAASNDPGFSDGAGSTGASAMPRGRRAHCRAEAEQRRGDHACAAKDASRTRPRYPNRFRLGETSPALLSYTGHCHEGLGTSAPSDRCA